MASLALLYVMPDLHVRNSTIKSSRSSIVLNGEDELIYPAGGYEQLICLAWTCDSRAFGFYGISHLTQNKLS